MTDRTVRTQRDSRSTGKPAKVPASGNGDAGRERRRSAAEIEADLDATTQRLAANVDALVGRLAPKHLVQDGIGGAKGLVTTEDGRVRPEVIGAVAGALVGAAVLLLWRRL